MAWPNSQDYNEAIQSPASSFADPELRSGTPVTNAMGMPMPRSGNFADVYEYVGASGEKWAVKCFTREVAGLHERYSEISKHLVQAKLPFAVDFTYLDQGIRIAGQWYPALRMHWVEGFLLNEFVRNNLDKPALLEGLGQIWLRMARRLREAEIAHADLQHGNVILVSGSKSSSLAVKLIDYDGMWVPALAGKKSGEVGHPAYQHPQRLREGIYSAEVDRLPLLAIACALRSLVVAGPPLWQRYDNGDNLLFRAADLRDPAGSTLFGELRQINDASVQELTTQLVRGLSGAIDEVPLLQDLMNGESAPNLPEKQAAALVKAKPVGQRRPAAAALMPAVAGVPRRKRRVGVSSCLVLAAAVGLVTVAVIGVGIAVVILLLNQGKMPTGADIDVEAKKQAAARKKPLQLLNPPPIQKDAKLHLTHVGWFDWTGHDGLGKGTVTALASDKITVNGKNHPLGLGMHPNRGSGSQVRFPLRGLKARLFTASVAVNDTAAHGSQSPLTFAVLGDEKLLWESKPVQMPHKVQKLSVNVAGIDTLELRVHCPGPHGEAHAVCVDPFITTSLTETELDDIVGIRHAKPLDKDTKLYLSHAGWSDWIGYNGFGKGTVTALETGRIFVDGVNHPLGLGMHPQSNSNSQVKFPLRGLKARMFTASVAVNDTAAVGSQSPLTFVVLGDGKALWESKPERMPHVIQKLSVNVSGIEVLELRVNCPGLNGGAHAVWLDPFITTSLTETEMDDAVGLRR